MIEAAIPDEEAFDGSYLQTAGRFYRVEWLGCYVMMTFDEWFVRERSDRRLAESKITSGKCKGRRPIKQVTDNVSDNGEEKLSGVG